MRFPSAERSLHTDDDDDAWSKKTILSLDGGGVRGLSSLLILQELMVEIGKIERRANAEAKSSAYSPLVDCLREGGGARPGARSILEYFPCHYFDYICGASTGGLVAIMVGRLRMSVHEAIEEYKNLSAKFFEKRSSRLKRLLTRNENRNENRTKRESFKGYFDTWRPLRFASPQEKANRFRSDHARCKTIVCSIKSSENNGFQRPFLLRSYDPKESSKIHFEKAPDKRDDFAIWEVARAAFAAPSYFKSIDDFHECYDDHMTNLNNHNPSVEAIKEVNLLAGSSGAIDSFLSLGSGKAKASSPEMKYGRGSSLQNITNISESIHDDAKYASKLQRFDYHRFEVEEGLQDIPIDEWRPRISGKITFRKIETATQLYLRKKEIRSQIQQCARILVGKRTLRAETMRWECFATGTRYQCPFSGCSISEARFNNRNELMDHMRMGHDLAPPDADHYREVQKLLDRGRTNGEQQG